MEHCDHACQHGQEHQHPAKRQTKRAENCNQGRKGPKQHDMEAQIEWQRAEENLKVHNIISKPSSFFYSVV